VVEKKRLVSIASSLAWKWAERLRQTAIDRLLVSMHGGLAGMRPVLIMSTGLPSCAFHSIPLSLPPKVVLPETALPETE
jgi:hypothetical protein